MNSMPWTIPLSKALEGSTRGGRPRWSRRASPSVNGNQARHTRFPWPLFSCFQSSLSCDNIKECRITWVVSGFKVKMASCKLPRNESMTRAPDTITTPITLKLGDVWASAKVKRIKPTTRSTADTYSWAGYFRLRPGMNAPITMTGRTWINKQMDL